MAWLLFSLLLFIFAYGCTPAAEESGKTDDELAAATATAQANLSALPSDLPIHANAEKLKFAAGNTYITYEVAGSVDDIVAYYRTELETQGWEKANNSPEEPFGGSLTILRSKPDKNISVTVQSIPESEYVRVLLSIIPK